MAKEKIEQILLDHKKYLLKAPDESLKIKTKPDVSSGRAEVSSAH